MTIYIAGSIEPAVHFVAYQGRLLGATCSLDYRDKEMFVTGLNDKQSGGAMVMKVINA